MGDPPVLIEASVDEIEDVKRVMSRNAFGQSDNRYLHFLVADSGTHYVSRWLDPLVIEYAYHDLVAEEMRAMRTQLEEKGRGPRVWGVGVEEYGDE
jgi:hypothetical protein